MLFLSSQSFACYPYGQQEELMMSTAVILKEKKIIDLIIKEYCIDYHNVKNIPSFFLAKDVNTLKIFDSVVHQNYYDYPSNLNQLDILSYVILKKYILENPDALTKQKIIKNHELFAKKASELLLNKELNTQEIEQALVALSPMNYSQESKKYYEGKEYKELIQYLASNRNLIVLSKDQSFKNTALHYALMTNQLEASKAILSNDYLKSEMFKKNIHGFTPVHLYLLHSERYGSENKQIVDILIDNLSKVETLDDGPMAFKNFAYLLKNNHPYFYQKLSEKFKIKIDEKEINQIRKMEKVWKSMSNYVEFLKEKIKE